MVDQKLENLLNLALSATPEERAKSEILEVGYAPETQMWELIVKYTGDIEKYEAFGIQAVLLHNGYAILTVPEQLIERVSEWPEIEYIEKPKRLYFQVAQGKRASCISLVQIPPLNLTGRGILVGIIDSGVDYRHPEFLRPDGTSRILYMWDQSQEGMPPEGYKIGQEFTEADFNRSLSGGGPPLTTDISGHGTAVAAIAAGNSGVAYESDLIVVRLGVPRPESFPKTTELMQAVNYVLEKALEIGRPIAVNLSFGNTYGSHGGSSLVETYLDTMADYWKNVISVGTGNEGNAAGHTSEILEMGVDREVPFLVQAYETSLNIQIWKSYVDDILLELIGPDGQRAGTRFLHPTPDQTLTIPSTAERVITVGAYDSIRNVYADFSGRGFAVGGGIKPDLAAPGVGIRTAAPNGQFVSVDGTSFATPFVTGSSALLMQYGITDGNDPFLYGEKVKAYLRYGARPLPGITEYPNPRIGWGTLCVRDSLPG